LQTYKQFNRVIHVEVGLPNSSSALGVSDLRVHFEVKKTRAVMKNTAKIEIYNLAEKSRNFLENYKGMKVILKAGYKDQIAKNPNSDLLYIGDILRVYHQKKPPNVITTIESITGQKQLLTKMSISYSPKTMFLQILKHSIDQVGMTLHEASNLSTATQSYSNGFSFNGTFKDLLDKINDFAKTEWSCQNEKIKVIPKRGSDLMDFISVSPESGMLDSPVKMASVDPMIPTMGQVIGNIDILPGWRVRTLLLPMIEPGNKLTISSFSIPPGKIFSTTVVEHRGDNYANDWDTTIECYEYKGREQ
jgi:hypothetical protein